jgi:hypothetical protein
LRGGVFFKAFSLKFFQYTNLFILFFREISPCSGQLVLYQKPLVPLSDDIETDDEDDQDTMGLDPMDID